MYININSHNFHLKYTKFLLLILILSLSILMVFFAKKKFNNQSYSIFIEFHNANGIKPGTLIRLRGLNIGQVSHVKLNNNVVLVLAKINTSAYVIPRNALVETNQTGLLNESTIDIIPLEIIDHYNINKKLFDPLSPMCCTSKIICNLSYLEGDRGLNYDDLIRATTRISQRFDDPRFFNIFYIFLQNGIELSDKILKVSIDWLDLLSFFNI